MIVEILHTDEQLGIKKGERYKAKQYTLDPCKVTLLNRLSKKGIPLKNTNPLCNQYVYDIKVIEE